MCTAFSCGNDRSCYVFRALFNIDPAKHDIFRKALDTLHQAANGTRKSRNNLAHNLLSASTPDFDDLVRHVRQLLESIRIIVSCVTEALPSDHSESALCEIDSILKRDYQIATITDDEQLKVVQQGRQLLELLEENEQLVEEHGRLRQKLERVRSFDSVARCVKSHIQHQLIEGILACIVVRFWFIHLTCALGNKIRRGGQGTVYRAEHKLWGQALAVKIFRESEDDAAWRRDLNSLTFLTHPNIVRMCYILCENHDDRSRLLPPVGYITELMAQSAADSFECSLTRLLNLFEQIARALTFAHDNGVIHFDVKPDNILLDETCSVAKLCDFGLAHKLKSLSMSVRSSSVVSAGQRGTLLFMAPEALNDHNF